MKLKITLTFLLFCSLTFAQTDSSETIKFTNTVAQTNQNQSNEMTTADKIAFSSLIVAGLSFALTIITIFQTRKHNKNSLKPIINVNPFDYSNCILIELVNEGVGSALIKKITVEKTNTK